jgi:hypothetical protein
MAGVQRAIWRFPFHGHPDTLASDFLCKEAIVNTSKSEEQVPSRAAKRARFAEQKGRKPGGASPLVLIGGIVIALLLIGGVVFALSGPSDTASALPASDASSPPEGYRTGSQGLLVAAATIGHDPYPLAVAEDGVVRFPLTTFDDHKAHYYTYMHEGHPIEFFVLQSKDGVVRAAFNACDVCFGSKKGYTQDGDDMVCNNCGRHFPADQINVVQGGCNPSPLERAVEGDSLVIRVDDIVAGLGYF